MTNPQDIIRDAIECRDQGQEPNYTADEYEQTMLAVARLEQKAAENIAQALGRVAQDGNDEVDALQFSADRARARASSVGKSATPLDAILADAERVAKSRSTPRYTRDQAESAMIELAKREARSGETPAAAFSRLCESDARMDALYALGQAADVAEVEAATKAAPADDRFHRLLIDMARMGKRSGETIDAACARLLAEDPVVRDAYAAVNGL